MNDDAMFHIVERDDDMLICGPGLLGKRCIARKPKLVSNEDWRKDAESIVVTLNRASLITGEAVAWRGRHIHHRGTDAQWALHSAEPEPHEQYDTEALGVLSVDGSTASEMLRLRQQLAEITADRDMHKAAANPAANEVVALQEQAAACRKEIDELVRKAEGQKKFYFDKQVGLPALEDFIDDEGALLPIDDLSPLLDQAHANGRYSEADWWLTTLKARYDAIPVNQ